MSVSGQGLYNTGWFKKQFSPCWLESRYSKVPIIRTGPIIRTVLIFLGTLHL